MEEIKKYPDFPQWLETEEGKKCNDITNLSEAKFLQNRLFWAFDAGRNCLWEQYLNAKNKVSSLTSQVQSLSEENKKLREALKETVEAAKSWGRQAGIVADQTRIVTNAESLLSESTPPQRSEGGLIVSNGIIKTE